MSANCVFPCMCRQSIAFTDFYLNTTLGEAFKAGEHLTQIFDSIKETGLTYLYFKDGEITLDKVNPLLERYITVMSEHHILNRSNTNTLDMGKNGLSLLYRKGFDELGAKPLSDDIVRAILHVETMKVVIKKTQDLFRQAITRATRPCPDGHEHVPDQFSKVLVAKNEGFKAVGIDLMRFFKLMQEDRLLVICMDAIELDASGSFKGRTFNDIDKLDTYLDFLERQAVMDNYNSYLGIDVMKQFSEFVCVHCVCTMLRFALVDKDVTKRVFGKVDMLINKIEEKLCDINGVNSVNSIDAPSLYLSLMRAKNAVSGCGRSLSYQ